MGNNHCHECDKNLWNAANAPISGGLDECTVYIDGRGNCKRRQIVDADALHRGPIMYDYIDSNDRHYCETCVYKIKEQREEESRKRKRERQYQEELKKKKQEQEEKERNEQRERLRRQEKESRKRKRERQYQEELKKKKQEREERERNELRERLRRHEEESRKRERERQYQEELKKKIQEEEERKRNEQRERLRRQEEEHRKRMEEERRQKKAREKLRRFEEQKKRLEQERKQSTVQVKKISNNVDQWLSSKEEITIEHKQAILQMKTQHRVHDKDSSDWFENYLALSKSEMSEMPSIPLWSDEMVISAIHSNSLSDLDVCPYTDSENESSVSSDENYCGDMTDEGSVSSDDEHYSSDVEAQEEDVSVGQWPRQEEVDIELIKTSNGAANCDNEDNNYGGTDEENFLHRRHELDKFSNENFETRMEIQMSLIKNKGMALISDVNIDPKLQSQILNWICWFASEYYIDKVMGVVDDEKGGAAEKMLREKLFEFITSVIFDLQASPIDLISFATQLLEVATNNNNPAPETEKQTGSLLFSKIWPSSKKQMNIDFMPISFQNLMKDRQFFHPDVWLALDIPQSYFMLFICRLAQLASDGELSDLVFRTIVGASTHIFFGFLSNKHDFQKINQVLTMFLDKMAAVDVSALFCFILRNIELKQNTYTFCEGLFQCLMTIMNYNLLPSDLVTIKNTEITISSILNSNALSLSDVLKHLQSTALNEKPKDSEVLLNELATENRHCLSFDDLKQFQYVIKQAQKHLSKYSYPNPNKKRKELYETINQLVNETKQATKEERDWLTKALVLASLAVFYNCKYWPRITQMLSFCVLLKKKNCLLEIKTGEGKSCTIAMVAAIKGIRGKKVDIVTSSPILAERDASEWKNYFHCFGLKVSNNVSVPDKKRHLVYNKNIVYGTVSSFAADILHTNFELDDVRSGRPFDTVIVDEVDSMLIDEGVQFTYLSHSLTSSGMGHLLQALCLVWATVSKQRPVVNTTNELFYRCEPLPFHTMLYQMFETYCPEKFDDPLEILNLAHENGVINVDVNNYVNLKDEEMAEVLRALSVDDMTQFIQKLINYVPVSFSPYKINKIGQLIPVSAKESSDGVPILILNEGQICLLLTEEGAKNGTLEILQEMLPSKEQLDLKEEQLQLPIFLREFVQNRVSSYVDNAFIAVKMMPGREYLVQNGEIVPVDYRSTGVIEQNKRWSAGLQQFLEMKHRLPISQLSLITNFMSNIHFFNCYKNSIIGVSGTLGSDADQNIMEELYGLTSFHIPTYKRLKSYEIPGIMTHGEKQWLETVCQRLKDELTDGKSCRAALVICEDISTAVLLESEIMKQVTKSVMLYTRSDINEQVKEMNNKLLNNGEIIVATNLAGRGTDIRVSDSVNLAGGLFVLVTFLPMNGRVEQQAFGRTGRSGMPGSVQLLINKLQLPAYQKNCDTINGAKKFRANVEAARIESYKEIDVAEVLLREKLFTVYCEKLKSINKVSLKGNVSKDNEIKIAALHEDWGMWIEEKSEEIIAQVDASDTSEDNLVDELKAKFDQSFKKVQNFGSPRGNFYHITKFGTNKMKKEDWSGAISHFKNASKIDEAWAAISAYNQAYCTLKKGGKYAVKEGLELLELAEKKLETYVCDVLCCSQMVQGSLKDSAATDELLNKWVEAKCQVLFAWNKNIKGNIDQLKEAQKEKRGIKITKSKIYCLLPEQHNSTNEVLFEYLEMGLIQIHDVTIKPPFSWAALTVCLLGVLQITGGAFLMAVSMGALSNIGMGLISEGISDCISGIIGMATGAFTWAAWAIGKAISLAVALVANGVSKLASKAKQAWKGTGQAVTGAQNAGKLAVNELKQVPKLMTGEFKHGVTQAFKTKLQIVGKVVGKEVAMQGAMVALGAVEGKIIDKIMEAVEDELQPNIQEKLHESKELSLLHKQITTIFQWSINESQMHNVMLKEQIKSKLCNISHSVLKSYHENAANVAMLTSAIDACTGQLKAKGSNICSILSDLALLTNVAVNITRTVTKLKEISTNFMKELTDNLGEFIHDQKDKKTVSTALPDNEFMDDIVHMLSRDLAGMVISIIQQGAVGQLTGIALNKINAAVARQLEKRVIKFEGTWNQLKEAEAAHGITYLKGKTNDDIHMSEIIHYGEKIIHPQTEGSIVDLRILSDSDKVDVLIYTEDNSGKRKLERHIPCETPNSQTVTLLYDTKTGHYKPIVEGKIVNVASVEKNCLFSSFVFAKEGMVHMEAETLSIKTREARFSVANAVHLNPQQYSDVVQKHKLFIRFNNASQRTFLVGGSVPQPNKDRKGQEQDVKWVRKKSKQIKEESGSDNRSKRTKNAGNGDGIYETAKDHRKVIKELKKKDNDITRHVQVDHFPPKKAIENAQETKIGKIYLGNQNNTLNQHGQGLPSVVISHDHHKETFSYGAYTHGAKFQQDLTTCMRRNDGVTMFKLTMAGHQEGALPILKQMSNDNKYVPPKPSKQQVDTFHQINTWNYDCGVYGKTEMQNLTKFIDRNSFRDRTDPSVQRLMSFINPAQTRKKQ